MVLDVEGVSNCLQHLPAAELTQGVISADPVRSATAVSQISATDLVVRGFKIDQIQRKTAAKHGNDLEIVKEALDLCPTPYESFYKLVLRVLLLNRTGSGFTPVPDEFLGFYEIYVLLKLGGGKSMQETARLLLQEIQDLFEESQTLSNPARALGRSWGACFGVTKAGYYGMFPPGAQVETTFS